MRVLALTQTLPRIVITKHPQFRVIHCNGVVGNLGVDEGKMTFYTDIIEPRIKTGGKFGEMETDIINREIQVDIRMTTMQFISFFNWMKTQIKNLEDKGILKKAEKPPQKKADEYRV
jgi:hypothetical protein